MQAITLWLLARPYNAILALTATLFLPAPQLISGAIVVLLVLSKGFRKAVTALFIPAAVATVIPLIFGGSLISILSLMVGTWVPALLLALVLVKTRSLTLTLQMLVIMAIVALTLFQLVVPDSVAFWQPYLDTMTQLLRENGMQLDAELLTADIMTISAAFVFWALYATALLFGYSLYKQLPMETVEFGWFKDLDFGRIIAFALAIFSILAFTFGSSWYQSIAFILFAMFMMQGLAILHWLRSEGMMPLIVVVSVYIILPFLQIFLVMALSIIGYIDALLGFRRRLKRK
ncbi:MAG: hypothetical protein P8J74_00140 [Woeseiaceae bacterium]|nr:hypothetical protein [Woeseiaceae bacterium]